MQANVFDAKDDVLVVAYADWATTWEQTKAVIGKIGAVLAGLDNFAMYTFNSAKNRFRAPDFGAKEEEFVSTKPWLVLFTTGGEGRGKKRRRLNFPSTPLDKSGTRSPVRYNGKISRKEVVMWLKKHSPAVAAQFAKVKVGSDFLTRFNT